MGQREYEASLAAAEKQGNFATYTQLMATIRKEKLRVPQVVVRFGKLLLDQFQWRLGSEVWTIYEQLCIAAMDLHDTELAEKCLEALKKLFPKSARVARLDGMRHEQCGDFQQAEEVYEGILKENAANAVAMKRRMAAMKANGKTQELITALNDFLRIFAADIPAWTELGETYLSIGAYRYGAFCYEELILLNPMDALWHSRLADIYATIGGIDNLRTARKHYCRSIELNANSNIRAYLGLISCTQAIAGNRNATRGADADEGALNLRVHQFALDYLQQFYSEHAASDLADIAQDAIKAI